MFAPGDPSRAGRVIGRDGRSPGADLKAETASFSSI
jgi:hypothetical protein